MSSVPNPKKLFSSTTEKKADFDEEVVTTQKKWVQNRETGLEKLDAYLEQQFQKQLKKIHKRRKKLLKQIEKRGHGQIMLVRIEDGYMFWKGKFYLFPLDEDLLRAKTEKYRDQILQKLASQKACLKLNQAPKSLSVWLVINCELPEEEASSPPQASDEQASDEQAEESGEQASGEQAEESGEQASGEQAEESSEQASGEQASGEQASGEQAENEQVESDHQGTESDGDSTDTETESELTLEPPAEPAPEAQLGGEPVAESTLEPPAEPVPEAQPEAEPSPEAQPEQAPEPAPEPQPDSEPKTE